MSKRYPLSDEDLSWMRLSINLGKKSIVENAGKPNVGVVIVRNGELLGQSYRGETGAGRHAEFGLIDRLGKEMLADATVYTTLEPCSRRNLPKQPCAKHLIDARVGTVYIGMYDPNPVIYREGWRMLRDAGVILRDYPDGLRSEIQRDNAQFIESFRATVGQRGEAHFDYQQDGGRYELRHDDIQVITRWTQAGAGSIHALDYDGLVAHARYAREFEEVDNPGSLDWSNYSVTVREGEIVVFRTPLTYALIKIIKVHAGPSYGDDYTALRFEYELLSRLD